MSSDWQKFQPLRQKKYRKKLGLYFIEGVRLCREALVGQHPISIAFFDEAFQETAFWPEMEQALKQRAVPVRILKSSNFRKLADTQTPQGILFVLPIPAIPDFEADAKGWEKIVFLENIKDPGNVGTLIRTADWFGVDAVLLSPECVDLYNPKVVRSSMGSIFHLSVIQVSDTSEALTRLKNCGFTIVVTTVEEKRKKTEIWRYPVAIVLGSEAEGVSEPVYRAADSTYSIHRFGSAESLNVAIAGGIIMEKLARESAEL